MEKPVVGTKGEYTEGGKTYQTEITEVHDYDDGNMKGWTYIKVIHDYNSGKPYVMEMFRPDGYNSAARSTASGMPPAYAAKTMNDFKWEKYREDTKFTQKLAEAFIFRFEEFRRQGRGFYIYSKTKGSGKTMLACCLANEALKRYDFSLRFVSTTQYIEIAKDDSELRDRIRQCTLLILDDFGVQDTKHEWINEFIFGLIDYRNVNHLMTLFTSNLPLESFQKTLDREYSRIHDVSLEINLPEQSIRNENADRFNSEFMKEILRDM